MNGIDASLNTVCCQVQHPIPINPALYKFISIIRASKEIRVLCNEKRVVPWLREIDAGLNSCSEPTYRHFVFSALGLDFSSGSKIIQKRQSIALQYAKILEPYVPDEDGGIDQDFDYLQLVRTVKTVFKNHLRQNKDLFSNGIEISIERSCFYAKVERKRPFIFGLGKYLNKGQFGIVNEVYEIASRQFFALKRAVSNPRSLKQMAKEVNNLQKLHTIAAANQLSVEGIQTSPLATFHILNTAHGDLVGFLGPMYGVDLYKWTYEEHTNAERIAMGKSLMQAYKHSMEIGFWHGDIKPQNVLSHEGGVIIIDWAGSILYEKAVKKFLVPSTRTYEYIHFEDRERLNDILKNSSTLSNFEALFLQAAKTLDLFSLSIVLFTILVPCHPFMLFEHEKYKFPYTEEGIHQNSMRKLIERKYGPDVIHVISKMLAHHSVDRYSVQEAIEIWEKIT